MIVTVQLEVKLYAFRRVIILLLKASELEEICMPWEESSDGGSIKFKRDNICVKCPAFIDLRELPL